MAPVVFYFDNQIAPILLNLPQDDLQQDDLQHETTEEEEWEEMRNYLGIIQDELQKLC